MTTAQIKKLQNEAVRNEFKRVSNTQLVNAQGALNNSQYARDSKQFLKSIETVRGYIADAVQLRKEAKKIDDALKAADEPKAPAPKK